MNAPSVYPEHIAFFHERGYLILRDVLLKEHLTAVIGEFENEIDARARKMAEEGRIADLHESEPFDRRTIFLVEQAEDFLKGLDISYPLVKNLDPSAHLYCGPALFEFLHNERLLDCVEPLVGPKILSNPIQHLRPKLPNRLLGKDPFSTPWHQDSSVLRPEADEVFILTVWIPLVDVTLEKGPLEVIAGSHKLSLLDHEIGEGGPQVVAEALPDIEPTQLPVNVGDVIFMHTNTIHRTSPNLTDRLRWSMDLRYQHPDDPTGRPVLPSFVVRDRDHPENEMRDHERWVRMWMEAKEKLVASDYTYYRWPPAASASLETGY